MEVFLEKFVLAILSGSLIVVFTNPMNFDAVQRVTLGVAIIALAAFTARTLIKTRAGAKEQQMAATALHPAPERPALANPSVAVTPSVPEQLAESKSNLQEKLPDLISDKAKPASERPTIRENTAAEILAHLKGISSYQFNNKVEELYVGLWTREPGWQATVSELPSKSSASGWVCSLKEVGSGTSVTAMTVQDVSKLRPGDSVTVSGRIYTVSILDFVVLEDATLRGDNVPSH